MEISISLECTHYLKDVSRQCMIKQENCTVLSLSRALSRMLYKFAGQECFIQTKEVK